MEQEHYFFGHAVSFALSNDLGARELGENFNPLFVRSFVCFCSNAVVVRERQMARGRPHRGRQQQGFPLSGQRDP